MMFHIMREAGYNMRREQNGVMPFGREGEQKSRPQRQFLAKYMTLSHIENTRLDVLIR
jgi:hypothetical protein